jgi:hypothetical protein
MKVSGRVETGAGMSNKNVNISQYSGGSYSQERDLNAIHYLLDTNIITPAEK